MNLPHDELNERHELLVRLAKDAAARGMPELAILYGDAAIPLGFEIIERNNIVLANYREPHGRY